MGDAGTTTDDYGQQYYEAYSGGEYRADAEHWRSFFGGVAEALVTLFEPESVLDAGCAKGLLVEALVARGVDAVGIDISDHAISEASESVRDRLSVGSIAAPINGTYDLITCIEVLEHMEPQQADTALDHLTEASSLIVFSSTPRHFDDPTHINVRPPGEWAARFAERGFFRRFDIDLGVLSPWAVAFERRPMTARDAVFGYETAQWPLREEVFEKRNALLNSERLLTIEAGKAEGFDELAVEAERRQTVIDELAVEAERRQTVIDELAVEAERRQTVIDELAAEADHRQTVIDQLLAEAAGREAVIDRLSSRVEDQRIDLDRALSWRRFLPFAPSRGSRSE
jgi:SAM-dependent methyltransferase